jgi:hypothetical protein
VFEGGPLLKERDLPSGGTTLTNVLKWNDTY